MQAELTAERPDLPIQILAVNETGYDAGLGTIGGIGVLPVLQDTDVGGVWDLWDVTFRDVVILDGEGRSYAVFNLSSHSLSDDDNYAALKALFIAAAETVDAD